MNNLPSFISVVFAITTIVTVALFYKACRHSKKVVAILLAWMLLQSILGLTGFYTVTDAVPPRLVFLALPALLVIVMLFVIASGKKFINNLDIKYLTILHVVRVPVELVLYWLFLHKAVPQLMTFEGRNFDIFAGLTAPLVYYFGCIKKNLSSTLMVAWNMICLALLLNIVINAVLAAPTFFQQFAFDQPNIAILYFPFNLLPAVVVPLVLLSHLAALKQLLQKQRTV